MKKPGLSKASLVIQPDSTGLQEAGSILRKGGIIAFPTETSYGLGGDPFSELALKRIFEIKSRPHGKPILLIIEHPSRLRSVVAMIPPCYKPLMERFWPGPLTLIFPARPGLHPLLTGGTATVGVRVSSELVACELCRLVGGPITATSANISGREPAYSVHEVLEQFPAGLDLVLDGGRSQRSLPSTVVGQEAGKIHVIRPGIIDSDAIRSTLTS